MARAFAWLTQCWSGAGDLALRHSQVQQQSADLTLELQAAGVLEDRHQVQFEVLSHTADLGLGQSGRQVCYKGILINITGAISVWDTQPYSNNHVGKKT